MKYRVQVDLSFNNKEDADNFISTVLSLDKNKIYLPTDEEKSKRPDLWINNRVNVILDLDDEGNNELGKTMYSLKLK